MARSVDTQQETTPTLVSQADVNKAKPILRPPLFWALMAVSWLGMFVFAFQRIAGHARCSSPAETIKPRTGARTPRP